MDRLSKFFGIVKTIIGILFMMAGIFALVLMLKENSDNFILLLGNVSGFLCIELYGCYLVYNGWTQIKAIKLKKYLFIMGFVMNIIIILTTASLFLADRFVSSAYTRIIIILIALFFCITDVVRIKRENYSSP